MAILLVPLACSSAAQGPNTRVDSQLSASADGANDSSNDSSTDSSRENADTTGEATDDPQTWIARLEASQEPEEAVNALLRLRKDARIGTAIQPLIRVWEREQHPPRVFRVIVELAAEGAGGPYWQEAMPAFHKALTDLDTGEQKSIENAILAAEAIGRARHRASIPLLLAVVQRSMPRLSLGQRARLVAIQALGHFADDPRVVQALIGVLNAPGQNQAQVLASAVSALGDARSPDAVEPLLLTTYRVGMLYGHVRRVLVAIGEPARKRLVKILTRKDPVFEAFARAERFNVDCRRAMGPDTDCRAPSNLEYKAALLLGDFHSPAAVKPLLAALRKPALPSFFDSGAAGPSQHTAILHALKQIGDPAAAAAVWTYANHRKTDERVRPQAIDAYSHLARDTRHLRRLARTIKDDDAEEAVRQAAGIAYGRLARDSKSYGPLLYMIRRYRDAADKAQRQVDERRARLPAAKQAVDQAKGGPARAANEAARKLQRLREELSIAESRVSGYRGFQRDFERNLARAYAGVLCGDDRACYVGLLNKPAAQLLRADKTGVTAHLRDWQAWTEQEQKQFHRALVDRALVELGKLGRSSGEMASALLEHAGSSDGRMRQQILVTLAKVAPLPCDRCVQRLDSIMEEQRDVMTLSALTRETEVVRNYFTWAGR